MHIKQQIPDGAIREETNGRGRPSLISPFAIERLAKRLEYGEKKYSARNWEKGMPYSRYVDAILRHTMAYMKGLSDEDHLAAIMFNAMALIHHEEVGDNERLNDMTQYIL